MRTEDLDKMREVFPTWVEKLGPIVRVCMHSPDLSEEQLVREMFPDASYVRHTVDSWDVSAGPAPDGKFDLIVMCNMMMCAADPARWFENLRSSADNVWIQDLIRAWRNGSEELARETGDVARYCHSGRGVKARVETAYDLAELGKSLREFETYTGDPPDGPHDCLKYIAWVCYDPSHDERSENEASGREEPEDPSSELTKDPATSVPVTTTSPESKKTKPGKAGKTKAEPV